MTNVGAAVNMAVEAINAAATENKAAMAIKEATMNGVAIAKATANVASANPAAMEIVVAAAAGNSVNGRGYDGDCGGGD